MNRHVVIAAFPVLVTLMLAGCASSSRHHSRYDIPHWEIPQCEQQVQREQLMTHSGNSGAVIFAPGAEADPSWYAYQRQIAPEQDRRDGALAVGEPDPTADWYRWPVNEQPTLEDQEYFHSSRNANVYTYPGRDGHSSRSHRGSSRSHGVYPRRRVR